MLATSSNESSKPHSNFNSSNFKGCPLSLLQKEQEPMNSDENSFGLQDLCQEKYSGTKVISEWFIFARTSQLDLCHFYWQSGKQMEESELDLQ